MFVFDFVSCLMGDLLSFTVGDVVAALWPEDGVYYAAEVIAVFFKHGKCMVEVEFVEDKQRVIVPAAELYYRMFHYLPS